MLKRKSYLKAFALGLAAIALAFCMIIPSQAATKTQTRTQVGPACAIKATMTFQFSNGIVSNGKCTSAKKADAFWFCVYNNVIKDPYRYSSNQYYGVHTSGLWAEPGEK